MLRTVEVVLLFATMFPCILWSQVSINAHVHAEIIEAIEANETSNLSFGRFAPEINGGTLTITPEGVRVSDGSVVVAPGRYSPARFVVSGSPALGFTVSLHNEHVIITHTENGKTMTVGEWTANPPLGNMAAKLHNGAQEVSIGATLFVGTMLDNPPGIYTGTVMITFVYN